MLGDRMSDHGERDGDVEFCATFDPYDGIVRNMTGEPHIIRTAKRLAIVGCFVVLSAIGAVVGSARYSLPKPKPETWYRDKLAAQLQGGIEAVVPYGRADVTTAVYAIEIDFAHKFKEGIGQALWYAWCLDRKPGLALIAENGDLDARAILDRIAAHSDIALWAVDEGTGRAIEWRKQP